MPGFLSKHYNKKSYRPRRIGFFLSYFIFKKTLSGLTSKGTILFLFLTFKEQNTMKNTLKLLFAFLFILNSNSFYAQKIITTEKSDQTQSLGIRQKD
jgi:hypothetical protein